MSIYWRDLFKPRFAVVVVAVRQGLFDSLSITRGAGAVELNNSDEARGVVYTGAITVPCIMDRPFQLISDTYNHCE